MPRLKKARKTSDKGVTTSLYLRRGNIARAERFARREGISLSSYVDRAIEERVIRDQEATASAAA